VSSSAVQRTLRRLRHRYTVEQLSRLGPWQIREVLPMLDSRIVATCPDQEMADAIAKFLNGDPEGAYRHLLFHEFGEDEEEDA
jgi:hypothetical protein